MIYIQTTFQLKNYHANFSNQTRYFCCILMNLIYISCCYNTKQCQEKNSYLLIVVTTADVNLIYQHVANTSSLI